jgi:L-alanine-DL-glutamate epimerase-like enolase superfamily enzyme
MSDHGVATSAVDIAHGDAFAQRVHQPVHTLLDGRRHVRRTGLPRTASQTHPLRTRANFYPSRPFTDQP